MATNTFEIFQSSFIEAIFDLTSDERWTMETAHFSERHFVSEEEAKNLARFNPSQMHSFFSEEWDDERIRDEIILEVLNKESFVKKLFSSGRDCLSEVLIPLKGCGTSVTCIRDSENNVTGYKTAACDMAVVVFGVEFSRAGGYDAVYRMMLKTVYPANSALIKKVRTGRF